jgi:hypothetical protein
MQLLFSRQRFSDPLLPIAADVHLAPLSKKAVKRESEYKRSFEGSDRVNTLGVYHQPTNYARFSREVFEGRGKSNFSQHAAQILSNNSNSSMNSSGWYDKK